VMIYYDDMLRSVSIALLLLVIDYLASVLSAMCLTITPTENRLQQARPGWFRVRQVMGVMMMMMMMMMTVLIDMTVDFLNVAEQTVVVDSADHKQLEIVLQSDVD